MFNFQQIPELYLIAGVFIWLLIITILIIIFKIVEFRVEQDKKEIKKVNTDSILDNLRNEGII